MVCHTNFEVHRTGDVTSLYAFQAMVQDMIKYQNKMVSNTMEFVKRALASAQKSLRVDIFTEEIPSVHHDKIQRARMTRSRNNAESYCPIH